MYGLKDKVAIVTGGASGIGKATALRLLEEGAKVVIADLNLARGADAVTQAQAKGAGGRLRFYPCDVSQESDVQRLVAFARDVFGRLDCMVNNAGTGGALDALLDTSVEDWDRTQGMIQRSVFLGIKHAAKAMIERGEGGSIVNIASVAAHSGGAGGAAYSAAKAGVVNLTRAAAVQLAEHRIRCNTVSPGTIITPLLLRGGNEQRLREAAAASQPWPEVGEPEHVAGAILFLCSDDSRFITGENLMVDGGASAAGGNIYSGSHPLGNAISEAIRNAGLSGFDPGSTRGAGAQEATDPCFEPIELLSPQAGAVKRVVLITGVSRGLGLALAMRLAELGHTLLGCARSKDAIAALQQRLGAPHRFSALDITDDLAVAGWAREAAAAGICPDLLINNAAISNASHQLWRFSAEEIERVLRVNVIGTTHVLRHFLPPMLRLKRGIIVNFSSGWGRDAAARIAPYCASKWAIEGLTKALSHELLPRMASVSLHPGIIRTETMQAGFGDAAGLYPTPEAWACIAAPFILGITAEDNGRALSVPGMTDFYGMGRSWVGRAQ